ncbi:vasopressin V1b receptor [Pelobates cultripes]|uniref:Vasopressin V1b receptor n=1 Tax=Pelobates cultripes TaxID=61616 RepID=A0AAD1R0Z3_PELCU|nr:vasopressin V1b receptor [Pelobates cultripes]
MDPNSYPLDTSIKSLNLYNNTDPRDENLARAEIAILGTILAVTTVGNLCVIFSIYKRKKKLTRMHLFIVHLGVTDLAVAVFQILPQMIWDITFRFIGSDFLCRIVKYTQVMSMFASTYMLMMMTIDRYIAVCHPLKTLQQPSRHAYIMIGAAWIFSCLLSLPQIFIFSLKEITQGSGIIDCWADFRYPWGAKVYITWTTISIFIVPVGILVLCYSLICCEICKNLKGKMQTAGPGQRGSNGQGMPSRVSSIRTISRAKIRTVKMTFVIVLSYIICWTPFFSVQMWSVWDENSPDDGSEHTATPNCAAEFLTLMLAGRILQAVLPAAGTRFLPRFQPALCSEAGIHQESLSSLLAEDEDVVQYMMQRTPRVRRCTTTDFSSFVKHQGAKLSSKGRQLPFPSPPLPTLSLTHPERTSHTMKKLYETIEADRHRNGIATKRSQDKKATRTTPKTLALSVTKRKTGKLEGATRP